jgi:hypothetical protein
MALEAAGTTIGLEAEEARRTSYTGDGGLCVYRSQRAVLQMTALAEGRAKAP